MQRRFKLLYLTPGCFDKGGISRYCRYQIRAWREILGEESVAVFSLRGPDSRSFEDPFPVHFHADGVGARSKANLIARFGEAALRSSPEVIHSAHVNMSGLAHGTARALRRPSILNVYGLEVWSGMRADAAWGLQRSNHVIADCHFTARYLGEHSLRTAPAHVIWDCVELARFSPGSPDAQALARYGIPDPGAHLNLMTLGRLSEAARHKGYERLLAVFKLVHAEIPRSRLVICGEGDFQAALQRMAIEHGISELVHFTGAIRERDLPDVYRAAHVFSLVSDRGPGRGEGVPLTPLEAAACGVPIIVGDQDGSAEAVEDSVTGFVVNPFELREHASRIVGLARAPAMLRSMGAAARARIEEHFSYSVFLRKHHSFLEQHLPSILANRRSS